MLSVGSSAGRRTPLPERQRSIVSAGEFSDVIFEFWKVTFSFLCLHYARLSFAWHIPLPLQARRVIRAYIFREFQRQETIFQGEACLACLMPQLILALLEFSQLFQKWGSACKTCPVHDFKDPWTWAYLFIDMFRALELAYLKLSSAPDEANKLQIPLADWYGWSHFQTRFKARILTREGWLHQWGGVS